MAVWAATVVGWVTFWTFLALKLAGVWALGWWLVFTPLLVLTGVWGLVLVVLVSAGVATVAGYKAVTRKYPNLW